VTRTDGTPRLRARAVCHLAVLLTLWLALIPASIAAPVVLTTDEVRAAQTLLTTAKAQLPVAWATALPTTLRITWHDDLPAHVSGRAFGNEIRLDHRLLADWAASPADGVQTPNARLALATLIHELAHVLDRGPQGGLSREPRLRDLAGWPRRRVWPGRGDNAMQARSPDRYELKNPREYLAVNLEHYVLDADYACRRPQLAAWFQARLGPTPTARTPCNAALPLLEARGSDGEAAWLSLDHSRVYAIDYLFAEGNDQAMSRWGHAMLRLVICAPGRAPGPDCRLDLAWHRVVSFRAFVNDVQISSWQGLTGGYPSRLFVLPLEQVIDDYTQVELRGLISIPLQLDRASIDAILDQAAQQHWSYDGRYAFISNNCAVETWNLLRQADPRIEQQVHWRGITPSGLLTALEQRRLADRSVLADRAAAERQGYYFASAQSRYAAMYQIARQQLSLPTHTVEDWLALPAQARAPWIEQANLRSTAALLLLEQAAERREELRARDWLKHRLSSNDVAADDARGQVHALLEDAGVLAQPAALLDGVPGYGLPQADERAALETRLTERNTRLSKGWPALRAQARQALPQSQQREWQQIDANLKRIGERLRELASEGKAN